MRTILIILISFIALTALLSGFAMMINPDGHILDLPLSLLETTPFQNYLLPGILLAAVVGGVNLLALFYNIMRRRARYNWAIAGGFMISIWIAVQLLLIQAAHWLQLIYLGIGVLVILIAYQLKGKWAV